MRCVRQRSLRSEGQTTNSPRSTSLESAHIDRGRGALHAHAVAICLASRITKLPVAIVWDVLPVRTRSALRPEPDGKLPPSVSVRPLKKPEPDAAAKLNSLMKRRTSSKSQSVVKRKKGAGRPMAVVCRRAHGATLTADEVCRATQTILAV